MRFIPIAQFADNEGLFPVSGALYRFEPSLSGELNAANTAVTGSFNSSANTETLSETILITDPCASTSSNNVAISSQVVLQNFPETSTFGTMCWAWRCRQTGSIGDPIREGYLFDLRDGPNPGGTERGISNGYIDMRPATPADRPDVGSVYQSASFYNAFGNQDLEKFEINDDNLLLSSSAGVFNTGSQSFPGYYKNDITGSAGQIYQDTGSNAYRFSAFSPTSAQTPTGNSSSFAVSIFGNDNFSEEDELSGNWFWGSDVVGEPTQYAVFNIAAISVFNRVLSDSEVRDVLNYYTGSLGLDIGLGASAGCNTTGSGPDCEQYQFVASTATNSTITYTLCGEVTQSSETLLQNNSTFICIASGSAKGITGAGAQINFITPC